MKALELMVDSPVVPSASVCMWWLVCTAPFQVLLVFTSPSVSHGATLSFSLSLSQTERREKGVWTSRSWNTESSLSAFFIWFPSSMHTEHIIPLYIFIFKVRVFKERCALCSLPAQIFILHGGIKRTQHMHALKLSMSACFWFLWVIKSNQCWVFSQEGNKVKHKRAMQIGFTDTDSPCDDPWAACWSKVRHLKSQWDGI